jgi:NAD(P)-dependent dehydrogenase (short-subunit alcohol dehydrogenase family)
MNVLEKAEVHDAFGCAVESMGNIDILINGAGGNKKEATATEDLSFFDMPADAIGWVLDLNFIGTLLPSQVIGKHMADRVNAIAPGFFLTDKRRCNAFCWACLGR